MKSLRKSLNKDSVRQHISTPQPLPYISKPPSAVLPPQKVIRALSSYRPQAPQELPFQKGDFFYVLRDVEKQGAWYEAHNPVSGARGLVPRSMFEEFSKNPTGIRTSQLNSNSPPVSPGKLDVLPPKSPKTQVFYAVVLHDFFAERADELEAKRGDPISVVAQSNREWFVAKPIGRLGRPGLIPVTFVEIRDPTTNLAIEDVGALMDRGDLPKVEDWKRAMFNYKQNSIALGVIEDSHNRESVPNSPFATQFSAQDLAINIQAPTPGVNKAQYSTSELQGRGSSPEGLPEGILLQADVVSFHYEMDEYWFRIDATFQPYAPPGLKSLPPARHLVLFRVYNDFYDFQVSLLDTFPREAGRQPPHARLLPYMPGPAEDVDDTITAARRAELDEYLHKLCDLNALGAKYILEHSVVREFLSLKPGDVENPGEPRVQEIRGLSESPRARSQEYLGPLAEIDEYGRELRNALGGLTVSDRDEEGKSEGSEYEDEGYAASPQRRTRERERHPYNQNKYSGDALSLRQQAHSKNHQRSGSASSFNRDSPYTRSLSNSRSNSPRPERSRSPNGPRSPSRSAPSRSAQDEPSEYSRWPDNSGSMRSQGAPSTGRSRSHSNAVNTPPISAGNQQTAFIKIKIFDRQADDLIAIRVHPRVTHAELMDKVQARLGGEVANLRFRDSTSHTFVGLDGDEELREWLDGTDKHVLYAD